MHYPVSKTYLFIENPKTITYNFGFFYIPSMTRIMFGTARVKSLDCTLVICIRILRQAISMVN